ncbi:MAG: hypothetical protein ACRCTD_11030 [Beijerinckiaceae bacterium]
MENKSNIKGLSGLLAFLLLLKKNKIWYTLAHQRDDAIMVTFTLVGYRVEVEVTEERAEFSYFQGDEDVFIDDEKLMKLIAENWGDD